MYSGVLAKELGVRRVSVNAIAPGPIDSPQLATIDESLRTQARAAIPLGRFGLPAEIAAAVVYLASDAAGFTTGSTLDVNGGRLMR